MPKPVTFDDFVRRSRSVHGDRYDYTPVAEVWIGVAHKIPIVCPVHGVFEQYPHNHMNGFGCRKCGYQHASLGRRLGFEDVVARLHEQYPHYAFDPARDHDLGLPATWSCILHNLLFRAAFLPLLHGTARGCPACHQQAHRERRAAKRCDPDAAANLARVSAVLGATFADTYQRWLAGDTLATIGQAHGVTYEAIRLRLLRVRALLLQDRPGTA
jgi:hypothetical protein